MVHSIPFGDPVALLVVATVNLAECHLRTGQRLLASELLTGLYRRLCETIECSEVRQGVREQCFMHLRPAMTGLPDISRSAGWSQQQMIQEIGRAQAVAQRFQANFPEINFPIN